MNRPMKRLAVLIFLISAPVSAQIHFINPFAAPQGSFAPLVASATSCIYSCASPPVLSTGFWAREGLSWNGGLWGNNTGGTWNTAVQPYAVKLGTANDYLRFELHNTTYDHGLNDPSTKRRSEIETAGKYVNGVRYQTAYEFKATMASCPQGLTLRTQQVHWPSGASPAIGNTLICQNGRPQFRVTIKNDSAENVNEGTVPLAVGAVHDVVTVFQLGGAGSFEQTYLDGRLISSFAGPVGTLKENGYRQRYGAYGQMGALSDYVVEYRNLDYLGTADLSARIAAPPAF